jgi:hypothetical protein
MTPEKIISRRLLLAAIGGAILAPTRSCFASKVPTLLDHILLGCSDLHHGIDFVEQHTGVRAVFGGVHPGRGTQNALLSLGERQYLEVIAPDPDQLNAVDERSLKDLREPRLVGWAAHPANLAATVRHLQQHGIAFDGPTPGSRKRPDGLTLEWQTVSFKENPSNLLPFFIQWGSTTVHPSVDAPRGGRLAHFGAVTPMPGDLAKVAHLLGIDLPISSGGRPALRATIEGPRGVLMLTS